ncbi:hypothetical protein IKT18_01640 [Candidatus Saccharibacteria bacterium]|nr:hypothetical protein [Candidatus Saccharibacteria bacterium]
MDNNQVPQMPQAQPVSPVPAATQTPQAGQATAMPQVQPTISSDPNVRQAEARAMLLEKKSKTTSIIMIIIIVILFLTTATFVGLFIWINNQYTEVSTDVENKIAVAVADAKYEQEAKDLAQFAEEEKYPLRTFAGPVDYGELSFEYPKTWSVYVAADASRGGDFEAYFNPLIVEAVSGSTVNALRVFILDNAYDNVVGQYKDIVGDEDSNLSVESITVNGSAGLRFTGTIPGTDLNGVIVIFKIRDKTVIMQTDARLFISDFDALLATVHFNE